MAEHDPTGVRDRDHPADKVVAGVELARFAEDGDRPDAEVHEPLRALAREGFAENGPETPSSGASWSTWVTPRKRATADSADG